MSILIKGMEMPRNEPLLVKINPDGSVSTTAKNGYKKYEAVPVPPHGRLIDADKYVEIIERLRDHAGNEDMAFALNWSAQSAAEMPTVIEAEEET